VTTPVRWILAISGFAGSLLSLVSILDLVEAMRGNGLTDGAPVGLQEHYFQVGSFYSRGFTTGFFLCFSLMLVAIAVGTWYDERRRARGRAPSRPALAPAVPPAARG